MANNIQDILKGGGEVFKSEIAKKFEQYKLNATGRTLKSIEPIVDGKKLSIFGADHIQTLQDGRPPTKNTGTGELIANIKLWCRAKGIDVKAAYPITKAIHEKGTWLWWKGKNFAGATRPTDVLKEPAQKTITYIQREATDYYALVVKTTFVNVLEKQF